MSEYDGIVVNKPWGYEYLMYESDKIGLWYLHIKQGKQTSLHCHPGKKTGYILLTGEAQVSFLNDSTHLKAVSKLMLREGLFHSTKALSEGGIHVLEVESPPDKTNLVRLDDAYGRKEMPYEGGEAIVPMTEGCITFAPPAVGESLSYLVHGTTLTIQTLDDISLLETRPPEDIILIMDGGLFSKSYDPIVSPGDVVTISTFNRLAQTFTAPAGITLMTVSMGEGCSSAGQ